MCVFTGPLTKEIESEITRSPASNTRRPADKNLGPMLPMTKDILRDFYTPFNEKLAKVLRNDSFLWENDSWLWGALLKETTDVSASPLPLNLISLKCPWRWMFFYLNYFLSYKSRDESKTENSTKREWWFCDVCLSERKREMLESLGCCYFFSLWPDVKINSELNISKRESSFVFSSLMWFRKKDCHFVPKT